MKIYTAVVIDSNLDPEVKSFPSFDDAFDFARSREMEYCAEGYWDKIDRKLTEDKKKNGWVYFAEYDPCGDYVFIVEN